MWIIQEPNKLELWNKLHFKEKKTDSIHHVSNIRYLYLLNKYIKCNFGGEWSGTSTIVDVRRLKVKYLLYYNILKTNPVTLSEMYVLCYVLISCMLLTFLTNSIQLRVSYGVGTDMHQNYIDMTGFSLNLQTLNFTNIEICALMGFYSL